MVDPLIASQWGLTVLKWLREIPETVRAWLPFSHRPSAAVSVVPQRTMYHETPQADGTITTQIAARLPHHKWLARSSALNCAHRMSRSWIWHGARG